jgi:hypothetical protein
MFKVYILTRIYLEAVWLSGGEALLGKVPLRTDGALFSWSSSIRLLVRVAEKIEVCLLPARIHPLPAILTQQSLLFLCERARVSITGLID